MMTVTNILMLRDGQVIFSGTNEEFMKTDNPYIQEFIRGTEMDKTKVASAEAPNI